MSSGHPRRRFNPRERAALLIAAAGRCEDCGEPLHPDFHADHREPWARGGVTDVINGQALCPSCNRRKSAHASITTPPNAETRLGRSARIDGRGRREGSAAQTSAYEASGGCRAARRA
jgi:hypothetical protein